MKARYPLTLLCVALSLSMTACTGGPTNNTSAATATGDAPYEIAMTYMTLGQTPADLDKVEEKVNEITMAKINATVKFLPMSIFERESQVQLMISSGEKLDLMMSTFNNGISDYVNSGELLPLDDMYAQYGDGIKQAESVAISGGYYGDHLYAIPTTAKSGRTLGMLIRKDMADKYNLTNLVNPTYEDLDAFFARVKAGEGPDFYMFAISGSNLETFGYFQPYDKLGSSEASGVLMNAGKDNTTVVDPFETEQYKTHLEWMRKWYQAGYIQADAVTTDGNNTDLMRTGNYLGVLTFTEVDAATSFANEIGMDAVAVSIGGTTSTTDQFQDAMWTIPITSQDPTTTFKFLNLMYSDTELTNLLTYGIEGVHYVFTDEPDIITYPDGVTADNSGYPPRFNFYGDNSKCLMFAPTTEAYYTDLKEFNASVTDAVKSQALGYTYNSENVKTEFAAVNDVITQYRASLEAGAVDPDSTLPKFIAALKSAGIDKIIADNQQQLNDWLASNK